MFNNKTAGWSSHVVKTHIVFVNLTKKYIYTQFSQMKYINECQSSGFDSHLPCLKAACDVLQIFYLLIEDLLPLN